jgi:4-hydroxybenzoate polyprenyltransferase
VFLYAAGLVFNDFFDYQEDLRDRPGRPLPSGAITLGSALTAGLALLLAGIALALAAGPAAGLVALALGLCILLYDARGKRNPIAGPVLMGACRALSVLLGGAAGWAASDNAPWLSFYAAAIIGGYITAVSFIARDETQTRNIGPLRFAPAAVLGLWLGLVLLSRLGELLYGSPGWFLLASLSLLAAAWAYQCGKRLEGMPPPEKVQQTIGFFLRGLLIVQAMFVSSMAIEPAGDGFDLTGAVAAAALLALWPIASLASRRFYAS